MTAVARGRLLSAAGALVVVLVVAAASVVLAPTLRDVVVLAAGLALAGVLVWAPVHTLPAIGIGLFVFVPQQAVGFLNGASPAALALGVWAVRRMLTGAVARDDALLTAARVAAVAVVGWGVWLLAVGADRAELPLGINWTVSIVLAVVLPLLAGDAREETAFLWRALPWITAVAAAYVVIEYAVGANLVYGRLYDAVGRSVTQDWAVYRAHGTFGHPLYAATFFAVAVAAALARFVTVPGRSWLWGGAAAVALTLTVSRSALAAAAVGAVVVFVGAPLMRQGRPLPRYGAALAAAVVGAAAVLASGLLQSRADSSEASSSTDARTSVIDITFSAIRASGWLGSGPGTADLAIGSWNDQQYAVESSPLQILLSLGLPGAIAFGIVILCAAVAAIRGRSLAMLAALVAFVVAVSGYNAIEALLPLHALLGVVLVSCFARGADAA